MTGTARAAAEVVNGGLQVLLTALAAPLLRRRYNSWGATATEVAGPLPGDEIVPYPRLGHTRAVTVDAPPSAVWPWIAQMGQGRGGFYSFDGLENLFGCRIRSADAILGAHQDVRPGDLIRLTPRDYPSFRVDSVTPPATLVLVSARPGTGATSPDDPVVTWQWALRPRDDGRRTRLLVRQRLSCPRSQRLLWHLVEPIDFVMERKMLLGIQRRAARRDVQLSPGRS